MQNIVCSLFIFIIFLVLIRILFSEVILLFTHYPNEIVKMSIQIQTTVAFQQNLLLFVINILILMYKVCSNVTCHKFYWFIKIIPSDLFQFADQYLSFLLHLSLNILFFLCLFLFPLLNSFFEQIFFILDPHYCRKLIKNVSCRTTVSWFIKC